MSKEQEPGAEGQKPRRTRKPGRFRVIRMTGCPPTEAGVHGVFLDGTFVGPSEAQKSLEAMDPGEYVIVAEHRRIKTTKVETVKVERIK